LTRARDVANVLSTATNLATDTETAAAISSHNSATTSVHGISDTSALATSTSVSSAISTHNTAANGHVGRGNTASKPASPTNGDTYANTETGFIELYESGSWQQVGVVPSVVSNVSATNVGTARAYNNGSASVSFTLGTIPGKSYLVTSTPGGYTATGSSSPISITGLQSATGYTYSIVSSNNYGSSVASSSSSSVTATTVPQAPSITSVSSSSNQATVAFSANATGGSSITGYTVTSSPGNITATGSSSPLTVTGLTNGTAYTFTAVATNANGNSLASSASSSVTPIELQPPLTNLFAWYDSSDASTITLSGSNITQWNDKSGNTKHATQSTSANQPTIVSSGLNGKNTILFDGTNDMFNIANTTTLANNFAVFAVIKSNFLNSISGSAIIGSDDGGVTWYIQKNNYRLNVDKTAQASMLAGSNILDVAENNVWRQTSLVWAGTSDGTLRWNKGGMGSFNRSGFFPTAPIKTIGAYMPGDTSYLAKGEIAEILIYNSASVNVATVEAYFTSKWGV
jgi:trimeric autotransporter adhesin